MKSSTTPSFWQTYRTLTPEIQAEARKAYQLWQANPRHPSLRFARKGRFLVGSNHPLLRALAREYEGRFYWFWIGSHEEYQRLIK